MDSSPKRRDMKPVGKHRGNTGFQLEHAPMGPSESQQRVPLEGLEAMCYGDMLHASPVGAPRWLCCFKMFQSQPGELRIAWKVERKQKKKYDACEKLLAAFSQLVWNACSSVPFFL